MNEIITQTAFTADPRALLRGDFPTAEFVLDQLRSAADDIMPQTLANTAVLAIEQRDAARAVLRAALAHLSRLNAELDRLRQQRIEERARDRKEAA